MSNDGPLNALGDHFYQGIADDVANWDELAVRILETMRSGQRADLRDYLRTGLDRFTDAELKGKLNRVVKDYGFQTKSAKAFLLAICDRLEKDA